MKEHDTIEHELERRLKEKDRRKRKRMKVSGKSVFTLQRLIDKNPHDRLPQRKSRKQTGKKHRR